MKRQKFSLARFIVQLLYLAVFMAGILSHNVVSLFITITAILLGPIFCGWLCFMGLYQDSLRYIGHFIKKDPLEIDEKLNKFLKYSRYAILLGAIAFGGLFLFPGKTWDSLQHLIKGQMQIDAAFYFLIIIGILSLFTKRFFCRYFCTFGARLGLYSLLKPITIKRDNSCISCKLCSKSCSMGIDVHKINNLVNANCINCLKCIESCPKKSLKIGIRNYLKP